MVDDESRDGYRVPACRSTQMNPATASFSVLLIPCLTLADPEQPPGALQHQGGGSGSFWGTKDAHGGREDPTALGNRDIGNLWVPLALPALPPPRALPSFSPGSGAFPAQPSQQVPSPTNEIQPTVPAAFAAQVGRAGTEGQPDLASSLAEGSTGLSGCRSSSRREQQRPRQQSGNTAPLPATGARRGPAHPCPPRLWSLQRQ